MKPTTPPLQIEPSGLQLLAPLSTGNRSERVRSAQEVHCPIPQRESMARNSSLAVGKRQDGKRLDELGDLDKHDDLFPTRGESTPASASPDDENTPVTEPPSGITHLTPMQDEASTTLKSFETNVHTKPLDFLALPLTVRKKIYSIILTVPALICSRQRKTPVVDPYPITVSAHVEHRELLPGIAYVLCQAIVDDTKFPFVHFSFSNARILRVSQQIHNEAKEVLYGQNTFEIANLTNETAPKANFKVPLYPRQYQRLIQKLTIKGRSIYAFRWMLLKGHKELIKAYPALQSLVLIFELDNTKKGFAKKWARKEGEKWVPFVRRLRDILAMGVYECTGLVTPIPIWIDLRTVFDFERYDEAVNLDRHLLENVDEDDEEKVRQTELKRGIAEAFDLFKRGHRC